MSASRARSSRARRRAIASQSDELGLAEETGGRIVAGTNTPETVVGKVFAESSSYYLLAYQTTRTDTTGRFRRVRVTVNRPGVQVVARTGYFGPRALSTKTAKTPAAAPEDLAITRSLPSGELPIRVAAAAVRGPFERSASGRLAGASHVVATISLREPTTIGEPSGTPATSRKSMS